MLALSYFWFLLSELKARLRVMHVGVENLERSILMVASLWSPSIHLLCLSDGWVVSGAR